MIDYSHLNHHLAPEADGLSDAWRRVLGRLGEYTRLIVRGLNVRPTAAAVLGQTNDALLVRLTTPIEHLVLRIAPEADLSGAVYFARALAAQSLPATPLIMADLSRTLGPFAYTVERYVCGAAAAHISEPHLLRAAARQAGRVLRRTHRIAPPGWGRPGPLGRWAAPRLAQRAQAAQSALRATADRCAGLRRRRASGASGCAARYAAPGTTTTANARQLRPPCGALYPWCRQRADRGARRARHSGWRRRAIRSGDGPEPGPPRRMACWPLRGLPGSRLPQRAGVSTAKVAGDARLLLERVPKLHPRRTSRSRARPRPRTAS
ncbi:hypothetical protein HC891_07660 [Candidatus Gracilibacteria bacterium]|nr:hypothetical protein [Candidatus Gracilibacteria bacterium]